MARDRTVRVLLVGGPMYDSLYERMPAFERATGLRVDVVDRLPHPELNARVKREFEAGDADLDLISTHTKYAPSQAAWLSALDAELGAEIDDFLPQPRELARIDGALLQIPRNLDVRLLYYRRDLLGANGSSVPVPQTWDALIDTATTLTRPGTYGFLFPGRDSGLFGTFYELLVSAGGHLFDANLRPAFDDAAGVWAADRLAELHHRRRLTPRELPAWHYDEISASFRRGDAAMVCDWPGSHHLYMARETCVVADRVGVALLPSGPAGIRAAYAGCHSFAIPRTARNRAGAVQLLRDVTSTAAQLGEARRGAIPVRASALAQIRAEAAAHPAEAHRWDLLTRTQEVMIIPPRFAAYPECEDALWHAVQRAMTGAVSPQAAVHEGAQHIAALVGRERVSPQPNVERPRPERASSPEPLRSADALSNSAGGGARRDKKRSGPASRESACGPREESESSSAAARASGGGAPRAVNMTFMGQSIVVTGGASGIGLAAAERFARAGADVAILDANAKDLSCAVERLSGNNGCRVLGTVADISRSADVAAAFDRVLEERGRVDVLVNNAGISFARRVDEYTEEELDRILAVNLKGAFLCVRAALPALRRSRGAIVSVSSMTGLVGQDAGAAYSASKGGLVAMTKSLAIELARDGIRVNCVCPAGVDTPLMRTWAATLPDQERVLRQQAEMHLIGRMASSDEIAEAILFLASPAASFITGIALPVEGGATLGYRR